MRHRWFRRLALSLGVLVMGHAGMAASQALGAEPPVPLLQPYPPVETAAPEKNESAASTSKAPDKDAEPAPAATLDRPIALREEPQQVDPQVRPTSLISGQNNNAVVLGSADIPPSARPLPVGPSPSPSPSTSLPMPAPVPALTAPPAVLSPSPPPVFASPPLDVPYSWRQPPSPPFATQIASPTPAGSVSSPSGSTGFAAGAVPPPGSITSPTIVASPGVGSAPGIVAAPGVVAGPLGAPLVDGCMSDGCCGTSGCCDASCGDGGCSWGNCCDGCCGNCCGNCCYGLGNRWWGSAEYLLWYIRGQSVPPLLTSGSIADNPPGAIGQPGTNVLFGGGNLANNPYSGVRLRGGYWFNDNHGWGVDVGGFFLGSGANTFSESSMGMPFLARPFFNALTGAEDIEAVATPNGLTGTFTAVSTFFLYGAEANLRRNLCCGPNWYIDGFIGWRLLGLTESLSMTENLAVVSSSNPSLPTGSTFVVHDRFGTSNLFNGGQIGVMGEYRFGRWFVNARNSIALGGTQQFVNISGSTFSQGPGIPATTSQGGLLAQSSNIGSHTRSMVSWVEDIGINLGYQFTPHIGAFVGYNFLYWSSVVRPGNQIDRAVNPNLIPPATGGGPSRPEFSFNGSNFWAQGVNFGVRILW